ncbi:unnamed protein product, partial [Chrysoparadoxa australica]
GSWREEFSDYFSFWGHYVCLLFVIPSILCPQAVAKVPVLRQFDFVKVRYAPPYQPYPHTSLLLACPCLAPSAPETLLSVLLIQLNIIHLANTTVLWQVMFGPKA